ncbi:hypothetical protein KJ951_02570, partial [Patescibacteria group bacterium]|nr:hypothetical protein [Patescibacteria group bacterium]
MAANKGPSNDSPEITASYGDVGMLIRQQEDWQHLVDASIRSHVLETINRQKKKPLPQGVHFNEMVEPLRKTATTITAHLNLKDEDLHSPELCLGMFQYAYAKAVKVVLGQNKAHYQKLIWYIGGNLEQDRFVLDMIDRDLFLIQNYLCDIAQYVGIKKKFSDWLRKQSNYRGRNTLTDGLLGPVSRNNGEKAEEDEGAAIAAQVRGNTDRMGLFSDKPVAPPVSIPKQPPVPHFSSDDGEVTIQAEYMDDVPFSMSIFDETAGDSGDEAATRPGSTVHQEPEPIPEPLPVPVSPELAKTIPAQVKSAP